MKLKTGWVIIEKSRNGQERPVGFVVGEGKDMAVTGYCYLHYSKKGAVTEAERLREAWAQPDRYRVVKAKVELQDDEKV